MKANTNHTRDECPSDYQLDAFWLDGRPRRHLIRAHIDLCGRCQRRLVELQRVQEAFERELFPVTEQAVVSRLARPRPHGRIRFLSVGTVMTATAAALLMVVATVWWGRQNEPAQRASYVGLKGTVGIQLFCRRGEHTFPVSEGAALLAGDMLRFVVAPPRSGFLMVVSVGTGGRLSVYHPVGGNSAVRVEGREAVLPGSVVLGKGRGTERIFALFADDPFGLEEVRGAVTQAWSEASDPEALRRLPLDVTQTSMIVRHGTR